MLRIPQEVEVVYRGVESGQVEAVFKAATPEFRARPYSTGLEGSAAGGRILHAFPRLSYTSWKSHHHTILGTLTQAVEWQRWVACWAQAASKGCLRGEQGRVWVWRRSGPTGAP